MKLLFVQGGSRLKQDDKGYWYTDGNFNDDVWKRYLKLCEELIVLLRREDKIYSEKEAKQKFNCFNNGYNIDIVSLLDVYSSSKSFLKQKENDSIIEKNVIKCDAAVIRSVGNYYTNTVLKFCIKYHKPYLIEVTGFAWEGQWYHGLKGKIFALPRELKMRKSIKNASYVSYVTNKTLQKRYPSAGITLGCSDVELEELDNSVLINRLDKIVSHHGTFTLGTAGWLEQLKGQQTAIEALGELKKRGNLNFKYQLLGLGSTNYLKSVAEKCGVSSQVFFLGGKTREEVLKWMDSVDVYIQPSFSEGLCRTIVEAISRACPTICSNAGGNIELIDERYIFKSGNYFQIANMLEKIDTKSLVEQAKCNFRSAHYFDKILLNKRREEFYRKFIADVT